MAATQQSGKSAEPIAPFGAEAGPVTRDSMPGSRESVRVSSRNSARMHFVPEPHEKLALMPGELPDHMDALWLPTKIAGMPNDQAMRDYYLAGWEPARAEDFPRVSGFGVDLPANLVKAGLLSYVEADAPVVRDDLMLVLRPKELSREARRRGQQTAAAQVENQMRRLRQASRGFKNTEIRRQHAPLPDAADAGSGGRYYDDEE